MHWNYFLTNIHPPSARVQSLHWLSVHVTTDFGFGAQPGNLTVTTKERVDFWADLVWNFQSVGCDILRNSY